MSATATDKLRLRVVEATHKDAGRGLARFDREDMQRLCLRPGDIVQITGDRATAAKVMPARFAEDNGHGTGGRIALDGTLRQNAGCAVDGTVDVEPCDAPAAERVTLTPVSAEPNSQDIAYLAKLVDGMPATAGDRLRVTLYGTQPIDFVVDETFPAEGPVIIAPNTEVTVSEAKKVEKRASRVSYEDIGGLGGELRRIREMIELPLRFSEVFDRLGVEAPKGVLLSGPPGCGKTLIARAIADEADASFFSINGPEVIHKLVGESEAHLRKIFQEAAAKSPSIIFLDEIDAIAPKRENASGDVERRVVAQLLALMDGLNRRANVVVIAATNLPDALDPALRRPGRFDREIAIPIPDRDGRLQILQVHSRGMPLSADVSLEELANITHGFVGADLESLCREAAMSSLRPLLERVDFSSGSIPYEELMKLEVSRAHFFDALHMVEPSAIREVFVDVPNVSWDEVAGLDGVKSSLREAVEWPLVHNQLFEAAKVRPAKGLLLCGPPGCGKTLLARAVASETQVNFISVKGPELMSKFIGESERALREVFHKARQASPCVLFFDELDGLVGSRESGGQDSGVSGRVLSQFLTEVDGIEDLQGVFLLGATNRPDLVDPAVRRPGRFDEVVEIGLPDNIAREEILKVHLRERPVDAGKVIPSLVAKTEGFSGAELAAVADFAARRAIGRTVQSGETADALRIVEADLDEALERVVSSRGIGQ